MSFRNVLFFVSLMCLSTQSIAGIFVQAGQHFGGDSLAKVNFSNGYDDSIKAGEGISASVGYEVDINETLFVKFSAGFKFDLVSAENGDVDFTRFPLSAMLFMKQKDLHFGVGLTQHTGVELSGDGFFNSNTIEFEDATGFVIELDYILNERAYLGLKLTFIDYQPVNSNQDIDGGSLGIVIGFRFAK